MDELNETEVAKKKSKAVELRRVGFAQEWQDSINMQHPWRQYWLALVFGATATLASGLVGGGELDGSPASIRTWGLPLPWLKRVGPTQFFPSHPVEWSVAPAMICFPLDTLFWSIPALLVLRWRYQSQLRLQAVRQAAGLCRWCGYDLRGSPGPVCPECGNPRSLCYQDHTSPGPRTRTSTR